MHSYFIRANLLFFFFLSSLFLLAVGCSISALFHSPAVPVSISNHRILRLSSVDHPQLRGEQAVLAFDVDIDLPPAVELERQASVRVDRSGLPHTVQGQSSAAAAHIAHRTLCSHHIASRLTEGLTALCVLLLSCACAYRAREQKHNAILLWDRILLAPQRLAHPRQRAGQSGCTVHHRPCNACTAVLRSLTCRCVLCCVCTALHHCRAPPSAPSTL